MGNYQRTGGRSGDGRDNPLLTRLRSLGTLQESQLAAVERLLGDPHRVRARAEIVREGERSDQLHVLLEGWAARVRLLPDGRRQLTRLLLPGDIADLDTLYLEAGGAGLSTLAPCVVAAVKRVTVRGLAKQEPALADALGRLGASDSRMLAERNACLGRRSAREHLAHLLCEIVIRLSAVGQASERGFILPITQEDVADVLGLTAVHVNRVLQGLRTDRIIEQSGHAVTIRDWPILRKEAGFHAGYLQIGDDAGPGDPFARLPPPPQPLGL